MASARLGIMVSCFKSVSVSQRMSLRLLAVSGRMTVTARPLARFALTPLRFVCATVLVFDFGIGSPSFNFAVKINCQHVGFCELSEFFGSVLAVVLTFPFSIPRLSAVFDVKRHSLSPHHGSFHRIVSALEMFALFCFNRRKVFGAIRDVVQSFFSALLRFGFMLPPRKAGTAVIAEQTHSKRAGAIDMASRLVGNLFAMRAFEFHW